MATAPKENPPAEANCYGRAARASASWPCAFELVAAEGLAAFSTRKLGDRLGCEAMSIYHHFPSKHHLLDAMVDHAIASIALPEPADARSRIDRLRRFLHDYRAMANRFAGASTRCWRCTG